MKHKELVQTLLLKSHAQDSSNNPKELNKNDKGSHPMIQVIYGSLKLFNNKNMSKRISSANELECFLLYSAPHLYRVTSTTTENVLWAPLHSISINGVKNFSSGFNQLAPGQPYRCPAIERMYIWTI